MIWVTAIWSMSVSACLALALVHIPIWARNRKDIVHLLFAGLALWRWDVGKDRLWVSDRGRALLGLNGHESLDLSGFLALLVPEDREATRQALIAAVRSGSDYEGEYRVRHADGTIQWIAARGHAELDDRKKPALIRGVCFGLTRGSDDEDRFRQVVEAAPLAMIVVDATHAITLLNRQAEVMFGYSRHELIGGNIEVLFARRSWPAIDAHVREKLSFPRGNGTGSGLELTGLLHSGAEFPVEIRLSLFQTLGSFSVLASVTDLTEMKRIERDEVQHRDEVSHLSRVAALGELSGSLAHELNQPLTAILSNAQAAQVILSSNPHDVDEVRGVLEDIVADDRRAGEVIRRLRALFSKGEIQFEELDLNELVRAALKLMNRDLVSHGVRVQVRLQPDLPKISGDRVQLQQVLINLILNAVDAMLGNEINDRMLDVLTRFDDGGCSISVSDVGCGIAADDIGQVFEPFHSTKATGMGLGLAVCRTIISAHAGRIWATNNPDRGACFHVILSAVREEAYV